MIRPFTCLCLLLAGGSGLYLYQSKHRVQMLDRDIEQIVRETESARARTGVLKAEWTLMSDPERLGALAEKFLPLATTKPGQFTTMADLDNRLPAVRPPDAPHEEPMDEDATVVADAPRPEPEKPEPPKPEAPKMAAVARPAPVAQAKAIPIAKPRPVQIAAQAAPQAPAYTPTSASSLGRTVSYAPPPAYTPPAYTPPAYTPSTYQPPAYVPAAAPAPMAGSSLGMARTMGAQPYRTAP